jgi:hypothetical protein
MRTTTVAQSAALGAVIFTMLLLSNVAHADGLCYSYSADNNTVTMAVDTEISIDDLKNKYHWNGKGILYHWSNGLAAIHLSNGSVYIISDNAKSANDGIPVTMGFGGTVVGQYCLGNIQIDGSVRYNENALRLDKDTKLTFPLE